MTIKKGVFTPKEIHIQYQKIQDVYVDQDIFDRMMGLYDVHIASATSASGMEAHIDGVNKEVADGLKNFFLNKIQGSTHQSLKGTMTGTPADDVQLMAPKALYTGTTSSAQYPIQGSWLAMKCIGVFFSALVVATLFAFQISDRTATDTGAGLPFFPLFIGTLILWFAFNYLGLMIWKKITSSILRRNIYYIRQEF